jgi:hypothetical protein
MTISWNKVYELCKHVATLECSSIEELLRQLYIKQRMSTKQIANLTKGEASSASIRWKLRKLHIPVRSRGGPNRPRVVIDINDYASMTYRELMDKYKVSRSSVAKATRSFRSKIKKKVGRPRERFRARASDGSAQE